MSTDKNSGVLRPYIDAIKNTILGVRVNKIDDVLSRSFDVIDHHTDKLQTNVYQSVMDKVVNELGTVNKDSEMFGDINSADNIHILDQPRIMRYREYSAVTRKIGHCKRALEVLVDNIISPDDISKRSLTVHNENAVSDQMEDEDTVASSLNNIKNVLKIDDQCYEIVYNTLLKGDAFVEILKMDDAVKSGNFVLTESMYLDKKNTNTIVLENVEVETATEKYTVNIILEDTDLINPDIDEVNRIENEKKEDARFVNKYKPELDDTTATEDIQILNNLSIFIHEPEYVIKLQSQRFRSNLGYLIFPKILQNNIMSVNAMTSQMQQQGTTNFSPIMANNNILNINDICKRILRKVYSNIEAKNGDKTASGKNGDTTFEDIEADEEFKKNITNYLNFVDRDKDIRVRYVAPKYMVHFKLINDNLYYPYGESIFDSVIQDCRILATLKFCLTMRSINAATDKRVIKFDSGLARRSKDLIEKLKNSIKRKKFTTDDMGTLDSISNNISNFEDLYIPTVDGKEYVSIDHIQWKGDNTNLIEQMKFLRNNIVANLNVPPAHVGIEEDTSNKGLLTQESMLFARTIISYQKRFSVFFREMFMKIYEIMYPGKSNADLNGWLISFPIPQNATYEYQQQLMSSISQISESYKSLGIPLKYVREKYMKDIDWAEVDRLQGKERLDSLINNDGANDSSGAGGMGGMGGGYGAGMGGGF